MSDTKNLFTVRRENHFWLWLVILALCGFQFYLWREIGEIHADLEKPTSPPPVRLEADEIHPSPAPSAIPKQEVASSPSQTPTPEPSAPPMMQNADLNHDGRVTDDERLTAQRFLEKGAKWAKEHDTSGNGFPLLEKNFDASQKRFHFLDSDHDGSLTEEEYFEFQAKRRIERKRLDVDRNGEVSVEEFGKGKPQFDGIDENKNGALDEVEIGNAMIRGVW